MVAFVQSFQKNKTKIKSVVVVYFNLGHKTRENLLTSLLQ